MNGIVNILKPPGMTSSNVISDIRRICQMKRVGHTGTLDPGACGVLPICLGKATKLFDYLMEKQKEYYCEICFGKSSDTLDAYGSLTASDNKIISKKEFEAILAEFKGEQTQIPPAYSALKVQGQKMYELARKGIEIQREKKQRIIQIYEIELLEQTQENRFLFRVLCSKGTYIRVLCEDIATKLHTCAYMSFLLRTRTGGYSIDQALTIDEVAKLKENGKLDQFLVPAEEILPDLPKLDRKSVV